MKVTVRLDKRSCQSSGRCARAEPDGFRLDDDHLGEVRPRAGELPLERLRAVARGCPALAITLEDETGREIELEAQNSISSSSTPSGS